MEKLDGQKLRKLVFGALGILTCYWTTSVVHEHLLKGSYLNIETGIEEPFSNAILPIVFPTISTWLLAALHNWLTVTDPVAIPHLNAFRCGLCVFVSTITFNYAVVITNYPVVMAFKSCNIMSVLLVAILCTRVRNKQLKLGKKKLFVGLSVTVGVFLFTFFDPSRESRTTNTQLLGIALLTVSLLADGFLPDWQAEIKSEYRPKPREMLQVINKWVGLISLAWLVLVDQTLLTSADYIKKHPSILVHLILNAVMNYLGQNFVYWMITEFKQHIVPFIISCRKIITIVISILWYHHPTSSLQIIGLFTVISTVCFEFYTQVRRKETPSALPQSDHNIQMEEVEDGTSLTEPSPPSK